MLEFLIYALMAWEAMQSFDPWIAYINATGGGIVRSSVLGLWSSNLSVETVSSIMFWNFVARFVVKHNMLVVVRSRLSKIKPLIASISIVSFGFYGLSVAPVLGWFAYYITSCGGGIISSVICSKNLHETVKDVLVKNIWTFVEGVIMSNTFSIVFQIIWVTIFIVVRVTYYLLNGRDLKECVNGLRCLRMPTNIGIPVFQNYLRCTTQYRNVIISQKARIRTYGCLCRRRIMRSF